PSAMQIAARAVRMPCTSSSSAGNPVSVARLIWHPEASLRSREPSGNRRSESVHTCEERLRPHCRREVLERRLMVTSRGVQHTCRRVQKHSGGWVYLWLGDFPGTAQPAICD